MAKSKSELVSDSQTTSQRRRHTLTLKDRQKREKRIIQLRKKGFSNQEIAEALGLTYSIVAQIAHRLIKEGRLTSKGRGPALSEKAQQKRDKQFIQLRRKGLSNKEIAETMGLKYAIVGMIAHRLLRDGHLSMRRRGPTLSDKQQQERVKQVVQLTKQRATLREIGAALGVTEERARQIVQQTTSELGSKALTPVEPLWTVPQAAKELGVSIAAVQYLLKQGVIPFRRRSSFARSAYLITVKGMEALKRQLSIMGKRTCRVCQMTYAYPPENPVGRRVCSEKCLAELHKRNHEKLFSQEPSLNNLLGWRRELWQRLQSHKIPQEENWLTISEACSLTGLSAMQMCWLGRRRIVTVHRDPSRIARKTGEPMALYAASEMKIAREVYEASKKANPT